MAFFGGSTVLSTVSLHHHRFCHGAVSSGGDDPDASPLCDHVETIAKGEHHEKKGFFGWFNKKFEQSTHHYTDSVGNILRSTGRYLVITC